jgi:cob(I)alamin adenosyltransferase
VKITKTGDRGDTRLSTAQVRKYATGSMRMGYDELNVYWRRRLISQRWRPSGMLVGFKKDLFSVGAPGRPGFKQQTRAKFSLP